MKMEPLREGIEKAHCIIRSKMGADCGFGQGQLRNAPQTPFCRLATCDLSLQYLDSVRLEPIIVSRCHVAPEMPDMSKTS